MKRLLIYTLIFCATIVGSKQVSAQTDFNPENHNYLVLTKNIKQLKPILLAAKELAKEDGAKYGEFHIVICGRTVMNLENSEEIQPFLEMAEAQHVKIVACGFSLQKFNVNPKNLPPDVGTVENGILYAFQLKKNGFQTISL